MTHMELNMTHKGGEGEYNITKSYMCLLMSAKSEQFSGAPDSDIAVVGGTRENEGLTPWRGEGTERWPTPGKEEAEVARAATVGGRGNYVKQDNVKASEDFWLR